MAALPLFSLIFFALAPALLSHSSAAPLSFHTIHPSYYKIPSAEMDSLRSSFQKDGGIILDPQSEEYEVYSTPWDKKCTDRPKVIFLPGSYENARAAFLKITAYNESYTIMNGGHDMECGSTSNHTIINLSLLREVKPDFEGQKIVAQAGAKWQDLYDAVKDSGFEVMGGESPTVGITGFTTGAGFNWKLSALYGSGGQNVLEALVILANGQIVRATRNNEYQDLMWGLFGAGGRNFAFILELTLKLHPYPQKDYNFFAAMYQISNFKSLKEIALTWLDAFEPQRPAQGYGSSTIIIFPQVDPLRGYLMQVDSVCTTCSFRSDYADILVTFPPQTIVLNDAKLSFYDYEMDYVAEEAGIYPQPLYSNGMSAFLGPTSRAQFQTIIESLHKAGAIGGSLQITHFLGSVGHPQLTSFAFPEAEWKMADGFVWTDPADQAECNSKAKEWNRLVQQKGNYIGSYINYIDYNLENYLQNYFGDNLEKLVAIKQKYDPLNKFNRKWGVPLSAQ